MGGSRDALIDAFNGWIGYYRAWSANPLFGINADIDLHLKDISPIFTGVQMGMQSTVNPPIFTLTLFVL